MLVLTRHANQSIVIGHDIVVTVLEVRGDQVRLGIRAPRDIDVHREEVFIALQTANQAAASPAPEALEVLRDLHPPTNAEPGQSSPPPDGPFPPSGRPGQP